MLIFVPITLKAPKPFLSYINVTASRDVFSLDVTNHTNQISVLCRLLGKVIGTAPPMSVRACYCLYFTSEMLNYTL